MKILVPNIVLSKSVNDFDYPEDVKRIQQAFHKIDYHASEVVCEWAWQQYSDSVDAGWINLPSSDEEIRQLVWPYLKEV